MNLRKNMDFFKAGAVQKHIKAQQVHSIHRHSSQLHVYRNARKDEADFFFGIALIMIMFIMRLH